MSEEPRNYDLNFDAANELEEQTKRSKEVLQRLAAYLAATQPGREPHLRQLVEQDHIRQAAELLYGAAKLQPVEFASSAPTCHDVFVSYSLDDRDFILNLSAKLTSGGITHFLSERDIQSASDWAETIWSAIRDCHVFVSIWTPRFIKSRWRDLEGGAAIFSKKAVLVVLRYVDKTELSPPFDRFQAETVENSQQLEHLVQTLKSLCNPAHG